MSHQTQLEKKKYRNWVQAGLGLKYVKEGLQSFCVDIVEQQHDDIINHIKQNKNLLTVTCGVCSLRDLEPDHVKVGNKQCPLGQVNCNCWYASKTPCPNNVCGAIYDQIIKAHGSTPPSPYWKNTDIQKWCTDPWSVAKCFINAPGYDRKSSAAETDCAGLLHLIINNTEFHNHIRCQITGTDVFSMVRDYRNKIFHSNTMELEDADVEVYIDNMTAVLQDDLELKKRQDSQVAVKNLQELLKADFVITTQNEAEIYRTVIQAARAKELEFEQKVKDLTEEIDLKRTEGIHDLDQKMVEITRKLNQEQIQSKDEIRQITKVFEKQMKQTLQTAATKDDLSGLDTRVSALESEQKQHIESLIKDLKHLQKEPDCQKTQSAQKKQPDIIESKLDRSSVTEKDTVDLCDLLGIKTLIESKISVRDVLMAEHFRNDERKQHSMKELPWLFLKRIMAGGSDCFDLRVYNLNSEFKDTISDKPQGSVSDMFDSSNENENISPLDIFLLIFQCCDPELRQMLFQQMYRCKMAVPFIYKECLSYQSIVSLWPLHSIIIENKMKLTNGSFSVTESEALEMPTKVISFARFGRPLFSKSCLLNGLLCDNEMNIFFHKDCHLGETTRLIADGYVEMFWLPTVGDSDRQFTDPLTVLNIRGNIEMALKENELSFIRNISDILTIIIDLKTLLSEQNKLRDIMLRFPCVLLLIASPLNLKDIKTRDLLTGFESSFKKYKTSVHISCTHNGKRERNAVDMVTEISKQLHNYLNKTGTANSLQSRLTNKIATDHTDTCMTAKRNAESVVNSMTKEPGQAIMARTITPVQCEFSADIGKHFRKTCLNKSVDIIRKSKQEMESLRKQQLSKITDSVKQFMKFVEEYAQKPDSLHYFLGWLQLILGRKKRQALLKLTQEYHLLWETYKTKKKESKTTSQDLQEQEKLIKESEENIENASFGIEHLFREIGHIYDALIILNLKPEQYGLPKTGTITQFFAKLLLNGQSFELIDGSSLFMPSKWIEQVLATVQSLIGKETKVIVLSVLGLQSSGKSTLLNTMFGVQFASSSGRCTRGINAKIIPVMKQENALAEYVLIIDTEGLRAPELSERNYHRDNELATIITGLRDITILNIMGENTTEIRDILQVIVHAFLKLKIANNRLDMRKRCVLIHQNVADISASKNMKTGLELTVRNLDTVTMESAETEGISDITTFDQVIEFSTTRDVWYLPNLWKGIPPIAQINREYSEKVVAIKHELIRRSLSENKKHYKTLKDIVLHTGDLWQGVLAENFVFSFKNSLEKKAYLVLEKKRKDKLRLIESEADNTLFQLLQNYFSDCNTKESLSLVKHKIITEMKTIISRLERAANQELENFFEKNDYTDIVIQWKETTIRIVREFCAEILSRNGQTIDKFQNRRALDILTSSQKILEEEFRKKSIELANIIKGKDITQIKTDRRFDTIWNSFVEQFLKVESKHTQVVTLHCHFVDCLSNVFSDHPVLYQVLEQHKMLHEASSTKRLTDTFELTGIIKDDISVKNYLFLRRPMVRKRAFQIAKKRLETFFTTTDYLIARLCQSNDEITDYEIRGFVVDAMRQLQKNMEDEADEFTLVKSFHIKTLVHVSHVACYRFEEHNTEYQKCHGLHARIARYKVQCKDRFNAHLKERNDEATAAVLFRHVIENFVRETIKDNISNKIKDILQSQKLPEMKYHVIIEILTDPVKQDDFHAFIEYKKSPKSFVMKWITAMSNTFLFSTQSKKYFEVTSAELNICLHDIRQGIVSVESHCVDSKYSIQSWLQLFMGALTLYKIPSDDFREVRRELCNVENVHVQYFSSMLKEELRHVDDQLSNEFREENAETVRWRNVNPYQAAVDDVWGCSEQCVFCGEPCAVGLQHSEGDHNCLQHRPAGCNGVRCEQTDEIWLTTCNYDIAVPRTPKCSYFKYYCNPSEKKECELKRHNMQEYRKIIPRWDIRGSQDMEDRSKFWLWFLGEYKSKLGDYYEICVSNIAKEWKKISKHDALESLRQLCP